MKLIVDEMPNTPSDCVFSAPHYTGIRCDFMRCTAIVPCYLANNECPFLKPLNKD